MSGVMRWFADDSDLSMLSTHNTPDVVLFGGFTIGFKDELCLKNDIEAIKAKYADRRAPIKWNFKDLEKDYISANSHQYYKMMKDNMADIRKEIFEAAARYDISIIVSLVKSYSSDKDKLKKQKDNLGRYVFTNGLMRFAYQAKDDQPARAELVMDWPTKSVSKPYDEEYASAYNKGVCVANNTYDAGRLCSLNFSDSILYTRMKHSTMLQLADMIVGATREFIQMAVKDEKDRHGPKLLELLAPKFRGYPDKVVGRGLVIGSGNSEIKSLVGSKFKEVYLDCIPPWVLYD
ncbi:DUF3800 domain-containing protein [Alteromonas sp. 009811495]|uniref:DUF3800 domain-containing protein n=1 Tax=Alteromonas sp. 009811495 TaxID=3002962 RepID=UPI00237D9798|nr:DUF3800 domain-containing protein [Alteromonas sp. 009811495]WDT87400.1 DUF3800 domain-containing protein [Alteromonas sp. 009811495]